MCANNRSTIREIQISPIPKKAIDSFIGSLPRRLFLFPSHPSKAVKAITLRDVYKSVLEALNFTFGFLNQNQMAADDDFLSLYIEFQTSLNPFLSQNTHVESAISSLTSTVVSDVERDLSSNFDNLCVLCDLKFAIHILPAKEQSKLRMLLRKAYKIVKNIEFDFEENLIVKTLRECGDIPDGTEYEDAWEQWLLQVVDVRYADFLGLDVHADEYYQKTVAQIVEIPFCEKYLYELQNLITHASLGMSGFNRILRYRHADMDKLASRGMAFFSWLESNHLHSEDPETIGGCLDAFWKGPSRYYDSDPRIGRITDRLLESQRNDGSWRAEDHRRSDWDTEADYLYSQYHPTWVCMAALRPVRHDLANVKNRQLGLI